MNIEIITIGDELLIGQVIDTNSAWLAQQLLPYGFRVRWRTAIGDNADDLRMAFDQAFSRADVLLVTGGLGPTRDDITKATLCHYFHTTMTHSDAIEQNINQLFSRRGIKMNPSTLSQADVPASARILLNEVGTASGMWFDRPRHTDRAMSDSPADLLSPSNPSSLGATGDPLPAQVLVSLPGVPYEMKWLTEHHLIPMLCAHFPERTTMMHHTIYVERFPESALSEHLASFEDQLPSMLSLAYLPQSGLIRLRLMGEHADEALLRHTLDDQLVQLTRRLGDHVVTQSDQPLAHTLSDLLIAHRLTLSTAESCSGGAIAALLTSRPGASAYFKGSVVAYSNDAKEELLGVRLQTLLDHGAVSAETVTEMAQGAQRRFQADCSIAVSGIAGPDGGTAEKPVGTIYVAAAYGDVVKAQLVYGNKSRQNNIERATNHAFLMLKQLIESHH